MTVQEVVLDLLQYIGVTGFAAVSGENALNRPGIDIQDTNKALAAVNAALQEIQKYGPHSLKQGERAAYFMDPTLFTVNASAVTAQSITFPSPPPSWINGCSIMIEGDTDINRIMDITGNDASLLRGYRGATATVQATVYADCALLEDDIGAVVEPVVITPNRKLTRAADLGEFLRFPQFGPDYMHTWNTLEGVGPAKVQGTPAMYWTETRPQDRRIYLRLNPMPAAKCNVTFEAKLNPERVTTSGLDLTGATDPAIPFTTINNEQIESVLLPIARHKFFSHPALKNAESRQTIKAEHDTVMMLLRNGSAFETAVGENRVTYI